MLAALLILAVTSSPDPVTVRVNETATAQVSVHPTTLIYGGSFRAEDPSIAEVSGRIPVQGSSGEAVVTGIRQGETRLILSFVSGLTVYRWPVGRIIVDGACEHPKVLLPATHLRVSEKEAVTLHAITVGSDPVTVTWYTGAVPVGTGNPLQLELPRGTYRFVAHARNRCGMAVSATVEVEVVAPRRRSARH